MGSCQALHLGCALTFTYWLSVRGATSMQMYRQASFAQACSNHMLKYSTQFKTAKEAETRIPGLYQKGVYLVRIRWCHTWSLPGAHFGLNQTVSYLVTTRCTLFSVCF